MNAARIIYRTRQFWNAFRAKPAEVDLEGIRRMLLPQQATLFARLQPGEQAHSMQVVHKLMKRGENQPDLFVAALLHDVGKSLHPLRLWERVAIVLAKGLAPESVRRWGSPPIGKNAMRTWRRPFIIAEQHPAWGADMAAQAGASPLAVALIRRHQEILRFPQDGVAALARHPELLDEVRPGAESSPQGGSEKSSLEDQLLSILQSVDDES